MRLDIYFIPSHLRHLKKCLLFLGLGIFLVVALSVNYSSTLAIGQSGQSFIYLPIVSAPPPKEGILFAAEDALYVVDESGSNIVELLKPGGELHSAEWSPNGEKIAYSYRAIGTVNTFMMNYDGSNQQRVGPEWYVNYPTWHPNGNSLLVSGTDGPHGTVFLHSMNLDGSNYKRVSTGILAEFWPHYSPDGSKIVISLGFTQFRLHVMDADGSNLQQVYDFGGRARWSPDGSKLLRGGVGENVYIMNPDGSGVEQVTFNGKNTYPNWSPDGEKIIFCHGECLSSGGGDIFIINRDGSGLAQLTSGVGVNAVYDWR